MFTQVVAELAKQIGFLQAAVVSKITSLTKYHPVVIDGKSYARITCKLLIDAGIASCATQVIALINDLVDKKIVEKYESMIQGRLHVYLRLITKQDKLVVRKTKSDDVSNNAGDTVSNTDSEQCSPNKNGERDVHATSTTSEITKTEEKHSSVNKDVKKTTLNDKNIFDDVSVIPAKGIYINRATYEVIYSDGVKKTPLLGFDRLLPKAKAQKMIELGVDAISYI